MTGGASGPRVVLVTGASSGIGRATAGRLASRGEHLVLLARAAQPLADTAAECRAAGAASVRTHTADVSDDGAVAEVVEATVTEHGRLDAVVNSAGVAAYGRVEDVPAEVFERVHRTNVLGSVTVARHALPVMRRQEHGVLVLVGSLLGEIVAPRMGAYVSSKWAVRALVRQLQVENRDVPGVQVCLVAPGGVDTPIYLQAANETGVVGRPPPPVASPETVARTVVALLDRPRRTAAVGWTNPLVVLGFTALPRVFDALVGPLFAVAAEDRRVPASGTGNVLTPQPALSRLRGEQGSVLASIAAALVDEVTGRLRCLAPRPAGRDGPDAEPSSEPA